jgi:hypothetical protein
LKLFQKLREGRLNRVVEEVNSSMIYLIHCKNFCKYSNELPPNTIIIIKEKECK